MANFTIDPNMGFPNPTPGIDPGPDYANNLQASLTTIGLHDHSPGKGVLITPNGMNINADLLMNQNNLTLVKTINFDPQLASLPGVSPNLGALYVAGNELYYNDEVGNVVPITLNGSVNSGAGSISGLPSGTASASFSGGTFVWRASTNTGANMDFASAIFRNNTALSKGLTLAPPNAMAADYTVVLPPPNSLGFTAFLVMDTSNNITQSVNIVKGLTNANIANQTITQVLLAPKPNAGTTAAAGQIATSAVTTVTSAGTSYTVMTGLSVTITTTGRPVYVGLIADSSTSTSDASYFYVGNSTAPNATGRNGQVAILNAATIISSIQVGPQEAVNVVCPSIPPSSFNCLDFPVAGTYTYSIQALVNTAGLFLTFNRVRLIAYEI